MSRRVQALSLILLFTLAGEAWAERGRPTRQQVEQFLSQAVRPLRQCLARSLPAPPRPSVVTTLEFDPSGGFPMPIEIEAAPGSAIERCMGEALAELSAPAFSGDPLRAQCRFPLTGGSTVACRPPSTDSETASPAPSPPPPAAAPTAVGTAPSAEAPAAGPPLSRSEVQSALGGLRPRVIQCSAAATPPPTLRMRIELVGDGTAALLEVLPTPPPSVMTCLALAVSELRVRPTSDPVTVLYPYELR